jgi:transcription elongation GreA/GreB family factor
MANVQYKEQLDELKAQLDKVISQIQTERQESKDDEINVLDELLMNKGMLEQQIEQLNNAINVLGDKTPKSYILKQNGSVRKISLVENALADSTAGLISKDCPLGKALKRARVGENLKISTPLGEAEYELLGIE